MKIIEVLEYILTTASLEEFVHHSVTRSVRFMEYIWEPVFRSDKLKSSQSGPEPVACCLSKNFVDTFFLTLCKNV